MKEHRLYEIFQASMARFVNDLADKRYSSPSTIASSSSIVMCINSRSKTVA